MKTFLYLSKPSKGMFCALILLALTFIVAKSFSQTKPWVTPKLAQSVKNPFSGDATLLADGKILYTANCSPCHGDKGKGNGPAAQALTPKPADHSSAAVQAETDGSLFWKLTEGRTPMPSYKTILTEKQRWELINYIRILAKKGK